ncbi:MAG: TVP38/TMEM64 family protein [Nitrospinae bacterium]|nr:TVP38/TMEM64 family protein [Nitrospinota bacterium]
MSNQNDTIKLFLFGGTIAFLFAVSYYFELGGKLGNLQHWFKELGYWGPIAFILCYILATIFAIPGTPLTIVAGMVFGSVMGVIYVSIAATTGGAFAFIIARYVARESVTNLLKKNKKLGELDTLTKEHGAVIVAITRLLPIFPYNLLNFAFGLTGVSFWTYVWWSWLCMLPLTVLYIVGADIIGKMITEGVVHKELLIVFCAVLLFMIPVALYAKNIFSKARKKKEEKS